MLSFTVWSTGIQYVMHYDMVEYIRQALVQATNSGGS